ncbi:MAG: hypothetical protein PHS82_13550 [Lachnospiraceae bacterium]|nr:hypothetical protein [Lachnospiraceae bacterium]
MKKFTKVALITSGIMGVVGVAFIVVAISMGITFSSFRSMVYHGDFSLGPWIWHNTDEYDEAVSEVSYYDVGDIKNLDLQIGTGTLTIREAEDDQFTLDTTNSLLTDVKTSGSTLKVDCASSGRNTSAGIVLYVPSGIEFREVKIDVGAGKAECSTPLQAREFDLEVGAGQLDMELAGAQEDYNYDVDCAIGQIKIGESSYSGLGVEKEITNKHADADVNAECAAGQIIISFEE